MPKIVKKDPNKKFKYTFRLLRGRHQDATGTYSSNDPKNNVIRTDEELDKRFNSQGSEKFLRISEELVDTTPKATEPSSQEEAVDEYDDMSLDQLKEVADAEEVDIEGLTTEDEIRKALRDMED